jgi:hypothetical protein
MPIRFQADADVNQIIVSAVARRYPDDAKALRRVHPDDAESRTHRRSTEPPGSRSRRRSRLDLGGQRCPRSGSTDSGEIMLSSCLLLIVNEHVGSLLTFCMTGSSRSSSASEHGHGRRRTPTRSAGVTAPTASATTDTASAVADCKSGPVSLDGAPRHLGRDGNEASLLPSCSRRRVGMGTGNGTNSARPVEKLRSCGNRRVKKRSRAKGWKPTFSRISALRLEDWEP